MTKLDILVVLHAHGDLLRRLASGYERQPSDRDELAQEMAIAVWKALPRYRGDGSLRGFVAKVAQFTALNRTRSRRADVSGDHFIIDMASSEPTPDRQAEVLQRSRTLHEAVTMLPTGQRECVLLALEGFSNREIAELLGIPGNTVDQRLSRARAALRAQLERSDA